MQKINHEPYDLEIFFVDRNFGKEIVPKITYHYVEDGILHCTVHGDIVASYPMRNIRKYAKK